ncbi:hypothetical protein ACFQXB_16995 [Plastorhodobacter daqingensis]|uniref:EF-hand domain-containing protein n=1 Tax=Plastorhodobacter daqingensis TaxID=1387281 RepID=A0ABW2UQP9_9RHOB
MKTYLLGLGACVALAMPALATEFSEIDADGDGVLSFLELQMIYPDLDAGQFDRMDSNGDGYVDAAEHEAAVQAGVLGPAPASET